MNKWQAIMVIFIAICICIAIIFSCKYESQALISTNQLKIAQLKYEMMQKDPNQIREKGFK
jgi:Mg2+/Co2+ transporter CorB